VFKWVIAFSCCGPERLPGSYYVCRISACLWEPKLRAPFIGLLLYRRDVPNAPLKPILRYFLPLPLKPNHLGTYYLSYSENQPLKIILRRMTLHPSSGGASPFQLKSFSADFGKAERFARMPPNEAPIDFLIVINVALGISQHLLIAYFCCLVHQIRAIASIWSLQEYTTRIPL
jgi:hypothetical protein